MVETLENIDSSNYCTPSKKWVDAYKLCLKAHQKCLISVTPSKISTRNVGTTPNHGANQNIMSGNSTFTVPGSINSLRHTKSKQSAKKNCCQFEFDLIQFPQIVSTQPKKHSKQEHLLPWNICMETKCNASFIDYA